MSTDKSNAGDSDTSDDKSDTSAGEPDGKTKSVEALEAELAEAAKRRDSAAKRAREAEKRLAAIEAERAAEEAERANKSTDIEAIKKNYETKLSTFEAKLKEKEDRIRRSVIRNDVMKHAVDKVADVDDFFALTAGAFEVESDDDGNDVAVVKNNPTQSISEFIDEFLARKPHLAKNKRAPGSGNSHKTEAGEAGSKGGNTMADFAKQPDKGKSAFKNVETARAALRSVNLRDL